MLYSWKEIYIMGWIVLSQHALLDVLCCVSQHALLDVLCCDSQHALLDVLCCVSQHAMAVHYWKKHK